MCAVDGFPVFFLKWIKSKTKQREPRPEVFVAGEQHSKKIVPSKAGNCLFVYSFSFSFSNFKHFLIIIIFILFLPRQNLKIKN